MVVIKTLFSFTLLLLKTGGLSGNNLHFYPYHEWKRIIFYQQANTIKTPARTTHVFKCETEKCEISLQCLALLLLLFLVKRLLLYTQAQTFDQNTLENKYRFYIYTAVDFILHVHSITYLPFYSIQMSVLVKCVFFSCITQSKRIFIYTHTVYNMVLCIVLGANLLYSNVSIFHLGYGDMGWW